MESRPEQGSSLPTQKKFSVFGLVAVVILAAIFSAVLLDRVQFVRKYTDLAVFKDFSSTFQTTIRMVHGLWYMNGRPKGTKTVLLENGKIIGVTPTGWPVNGIFGSSEGSAQGCVEVWNSVVAKSSAMASLSHRDMFTAGYKQGVCTYTLNTQPGFRITYNINTGSVATIADVPLR